ncbi:MAG: glutamine amidotransferase [Actinomycetota bacterium]|nr:glutamine amidotransferase [Actinomycetota bacterium]
MTRRLTVAVVYPDLLGTYGDGGNGTILAKRAAWRGIDVDLVHAPSAEPLPRADLYCIGGGEDGPQVRAARCLVDDGTLPAAVADGAAVLAVCAGYQLVGRRFPDAGGQAVEGLGLLDAVTVKGTGRRAVGEVVADPGPGSPRTATGELLPTLTGFENHGGRTTVGAGSAVLARVRSGIGNGDGPGGGPATEGAWSGRVLGTYLHGPVLARNPALADLLLGWATGGDVSLDPLDDGEEQALRAERLAAAPRR